MRRATTRGQGTPVGVPYFYPRSPCGERRAEVGKHLREHLYFYPRSPCGERLARLAKGDGLLDISIHALLAESDQRRIRVGQLHSISIHALLAESDQSGALPQPPPHISIHALLAESDAPLADGAQADATFLSTLSLRRATRHWQTGQSRTRHFYPRSPCGERQQKCTKQWGHFCAYETNFMGIASSC